MSVRHKVLDISSTLTIITTLVLFIVATVEKGLTHDLLLEAGVFLVSVKLIIGSAKSEDSKNELISRLARIEAQLRDIKASQDAGKPFKKSG